MAGRKPKPTAVKKLNSYKVNILKYSDSGKWYGHCEILQK